MAYRALQSQFAPQIAPVVSLEKCLRVWVGIKHYAVQWVVLAGSLEHVPVHIAVVPAQARVKLPVRELPAVHEAHGVGSDLGHELWDCLCPCKLDLADSAGGRLEELRGFFLEGVQGVETEEGVEDGLCGGGQLGLQG